MRRSATGRSAGMIVLVCGLNREAAVIRDHDILTVVGGGDDRRLADRLARLDTSGVSAVVSFGLAGALDDRLRVGDVILASTVVARDGALYPIAEDILAAWRIGLSTGGAKAHEGRLIGVSEPVLDARSKSELGATWNALAVDMESHVAAAFAATRHLPFGVLRVVSDEARHSLPEVAGKAMRPDGSIDILGVLKGILRDPSQIPGLIRTGHQAGTAFRALGRVSGLLGPRLGLHL